MLNISKLVNLFYLLNRVNVLFTQLVIFLLSPEVAIKNKVWHRCFPLNFEKFPKTETK